MLGNKPKKKFIWILPVAAIVFLMFVGTILAVILLKSSGRFNQAENRSSTPNLVASPTESPTAEFIAPFDEPTIVTKPENSNLVTPVPSVNGTPVPTKTKTKETDKPTPIISEKPPVSEKPTVKVAPTASKICKTTDANGVSELIPCSQCKNKPNCRPT